MATQIQASQLNMFQTTANQVELNSVVFFAIPGFKERYDEFSANVVKLFGLNEVLSTDKSGASTGLKQLKKNLINGAYSISSKVTAYALTQQDVTLYNEMNYTKTDLRRNSYQNLLSLCEVIYNKASALATELEPYKVTPAMISNLKELLDKCRKAIPVPRENINQQSTSGKSMSQLFKTNFSLLDDMDTLAEVICESDAVIYEAYKKARRIISTPTRHKVVVGKITNIGGALPIKGANIMFYRVDETLKSDTAANGSNGNGKPLLTKKSADLGGFKVASLPDGMYRIEIVKTGFKTKVLTVAVSNGETVKLEVEMEKV